jgi:hypothetical protein
MGSAKMRQPPSSIQARPGVSLLRPAQLLAAPADRQALNCRRSSASWLWAPRTACLGRCARLPTNDTNHTARAVRK